MGFLVNLGSLLTGKTTKWNEGPMGNRSKAFQEVVDAGTNEETYLGDLLRKYTGSGLTTAEQQANAWTASREDLAWNRQMEAANTAYQRQVADMKAAGINPMMAANSSGAAVPSGGGSSSVSPSSGALNLGSLISAISGAGLANMQKAAIQSEIDLRDAQASKIKSETTGIDFDNEVKRLTKDATVEAASLKNQLDRANVKVLDKRLDEIDAHIGQLKESADSEQSKRELNMAQAILAKTNAYQVVEMLPYEQAYRKAVTENEKQQALLAAAHTMYQNKLIDDGYLDAFISNMKSEASSAEAKAELDNIKSAIRTGDYSKVNHKHSLSGDVLSTVAILLDNFNPLNGLIGK